MTTLRYKILEGLMRVGGAGKSIEKALEAGNTPSVKPPFPVTKRWEKSKFQCRDIWTCKPNGAANGKIYVHQHGGAYAIGLTVVHFWTMTKLADMSGTTIILPDYPLPPDEDANGIIGFAAAHWAALVKEYGVENLKLGGDSAGGNLALAICRTSHAAPDHVLLLSPWVDLDMSDVPEDFVSQDVLLETKSGRAAAHRYAGEKDPRDPLISPRFSEPEDLPEVSIFTGELDPIHASVMDFAGKAKSVGKLRKLAVYGEFGHYWMFYPGVSDRESTLVELAGIISKDD